jgi:hypothetical protein
MRVLMTSKAGAGHFGPLVPFARAFRRAGAEVLVAAPRDAAKMVRAEGLALWAFDDPPAQERDAILAEVRGRSTDGLIAKRVVGDVFARIDARAASPGDPGGVPGVVARRRHQRDDRVRGAAGVLGDPS